MPYFSLPNVVFVSESPELNGEGDACLTDYVATRWYREVKPLRAKLFPNYTYMNQRANTQNDNVAFNILTP